MTTTFIYIPTNGTPETITADEQHTLQQLQGLCGGNIEGVTLRDGHTLYINEMGKMDRLPYNERATDLVEGVISEFDVIVGDGVLVGPPDDEGNETSVDPIYIDRLVNRG